MATPLTFDTTDDSTTIRAAGESLSPPWLRRRNGSRYMYCQAINWDSVGEWFRMAQLQRHPEFAQPGALQWLGRDKGLFRGISEPSGSYASRLAAFKTTWKLAGNAPTLLTELWAVLRDSGYTKIRYVTQNIGTGAAFADWWTIDSSGLSFQRVSPGNWDWDGSVGVRFWLIFYTEDWVPPTTWDPGNPAWGSDPDAYWGSGLTFNTVPIQDARALIDKFKAAGSHAGEQAKAYDGGIIIADPTNTAPFGGAEPFDPALPPGAPMPDGGFDDPTYRESLNLGVGFWTGL